ncbi:MAG: hypothetical protein A2297_08360 [Elusimicrobia bacterium RIFOXYB2_FULL_48_7]|nr:MAG: hypothetical protein A2297_08360 [Elusimicrobia bacterium RIFOXYB2_FULL_48_7]
MKKLFLLAAAGVVFMPGLVFAGGNEVYKPEDLKDPAVVADDYVNTGNLKLLKKLKVKKLVILECVGEFVTSKEVTGSASSPDFYGNTYTTTRTSTLKFDKDFYTNTSDAVYETIVALFEKHGIEIVRKETVGQSPTYQEWNLKEEKAGRGYTGGMFKDSVVTKAQKVSTVGLGVFPGPIGMIGVVGDLGPITAELGADGFIQVHFRVDKSKKFAPVLSSFEMLLSADMRSQKVGFKGKEKLRYDFYTQWANLVSMKKGIESKTNFDKKKDGKFDVDQYNAELKDMLYGIVGGWDFAMAKALPDNQPIVRDAAPAAPAATETPAAPVPAETPAAPAETPAAK